MPSTCINSEEPSVVVYFPEMTDEEFLKKQAANLERLMEALPSQIASGLSKIDPNGSSAGTKLSWLQTPLGIAVSCIAILTFVGTLFHFAFQSEFKNAFDGPFGGLRDSVNSLRDRDVNGLRGDVGHVQTDVARLLDWQAKTAFAPQPAKSSGTSSFTPNEIKEVARRARERGLPADVTRIQDVAAPLQQNHDTESWQALIELVNLRSFVNSTITQPRLNIVATMHPNEPRDRTFYGGEGKWILFEGSGTTLILDAKPNEMPSISDVTDTPSGQPARIYKNFIFRNTHIVYRGDLVVLIDVFFENCTFDIKDGDNGRMLADKILKSTYATFRSS